MDVYKVYVWHGRRLEHVAENIVAESYEVAAKRGVQAICSRPGDKTGWLLELFYHVAVSPSRKTPAGVVVQVAREPEGRVMVG